MSNIGFAEYLWIDGVRPTQQLRSKARIVSVPDKPVVTDFPLWRFDGSRTGQADGCDSDCILTPVRIYRDPLRGANDYIVLCEVNGADGSVHASNMRARMRKMLDGSGESVEPWLGFEQQYTLFRDGRPLGFPENGFPDPQGPYYCGVGSENVHGREVVEAHARACITAGVLIYGISAEVIPGQWEFQVGYRDVDTERCDALTVADDVWVARYLLHRVGEQFSVRISFDSKPVKEGWSGARMHANLSTVDTRDPRKGMEAINDIFTALEARRGEHVGEYGDRLSERQVGGHKAYNIDTFQGGVAHRGAPAQAPQSAVEKDCRYYLEDRRPGANSDPYRVGFFLVAAAIAYKSKSRVA